MMAKFFMGIAIVAFTSFLGYYLAKKFRQRKLFFMQLKVFNERFLNEVSYYKRPLKEFSVQYVYKGEFQTLLTDYFTYIESGKSKDMMGYSLLNSLDYSFLKESEKKTIENYFSMLGKGDSASQKSYFSAMNGELNALQSEAVATYKKYADLYVKMGFLFGLFILILIL